VSDADLARLKKSRWPYAAIAGYCIFTMSGIVLLMSKHNRIVGFALMALGGALYFAQYVHSWRISARDRDLQARWILRLNEICDNLDLKDYPIQSLVDLASYFDDDDREEVLEHLAKMPVGARSLYDAVMLVDPDGTFH
jgi:hypothetical protein